MTNAEVIEKLKELPANEECIVHVRTHTQSYAVAQESPFCVDGMGLWISLPKDMYTVRRGFKIHPQD
jgi:hypothetical protein